MENWSTKETKESLRFGGSTWRKKKSIWGKILEFSEDPRTKQKGQLDSRPELLIAAKERQVEIKWKSLQIWVCIYTSKRCVRNRETDRERDSMQERKTAAACRGRQRRGDGWCGSHSFHFFLHFIGSWSFSKVCDHPSWELGSSFLFTSTKIYIYKLFLKKRQIFNIFNSVYNWKQLRRMIRGDTALRLRSGKSSETSSEYLIIFYCFFFNERKKESKKTLWNYSNEFFFWENYNFGPTIIHLLLI